MNLNEFEFLGFYETAPIYLIGLISLLGIGLAFYSYIGYHSIPKLSKTVLIILRSMTFFILGLLLLNPVYENSRSIEDKPDLVVLVDQSASTAIAKGSWDGSESYPLLIQRIDDQLKDGFNLRWVGFDSDIYELSVNDSLNLTGSQTDIGMALSNVVSSYGPDQIMLVSDGVVTKGRDPIFVGQSLNIPVHTVAIGDSTRFQDLVVPFVDFSSEMIIDTDYTVTVGIRNDGYIGTQTRISLIRDDNPIESKDVVFQNQSGVQQVEFTVNSEIQGIQNYKVRVEPLDSEWSIDNNEYDFSVNFIDNRLELLYLTYQFHPDVSIVKQILFEYPEISVTEMTWNGSSFIQSSNQFGSKEYDLILIHGLPSSNYSSEIERLRNLITEQNTVVFMVPGNSTDVVYTSILSATNGFQSDGINLNWTQSQIEPESSQSGHPVLDLDTYNWSRSPLIIMPSAGLSTRSGLQTLLRSSQYGNIPAVSTQRLGNVRSTIVTFSGFGAFYLSGNEDDRDIISKLIGNVVSWSASDVNKDLFEMSTNKSEYSTRENVLFNARVLREDGSPESTANVELEISNESSESRNYSLQNVGNGNYSLTIPGLSIGEYNYSGSAKRNDFTIGAISGSFSVGSSQQELINTTRQDNLLRQISSITGGLSTDYSTIEALLDDLQSTSNKTISQSTEVVNLYKGPFWFILVLLLVTAEWLLRRKYLLP